MTYCVGIKTKYGLVMASDSRSNAGYDQVNVCRKMHLFVMPGERVFVVLTSGSLSLSQSILTLLRRDFDRGEGLATVPTLYDAARVVGEKVRCISEIDRAALERDDYRFNVNILIGGQVAGAPVDLFMIYPQGNPLNATQDAPFLQLGECKYGRPILDRTIRYDTTLAQAAKSALISIDSTMRSNVTVGPPIDVLLYEPGDLNIRRYRRFKHNDPDLIIMQNQWESALRNAAQDLPEIAFSDNGMPQAAGLTGM